MSQASVIYSLGAWLCMVLNVRGSAVYVPNRTVEGRRVALACLLSTSRSMVVTVPAIHTVSELVIAPHAYAGWSTYWGENGEACTMELHETYPLCCVRVVLCPCLEAAMLMD